MTALQPLYFCLRLCLHCVFVSLYCLLPVLLLSLLANSVIIALITLEQISSGTTINLSVAFSVLLRIFEIDSG